MPTFACSGLNSNRQRNAFTLVELLTVLAVIGVIAAIVIPVVSSVRGTSENTRSLSNLRQIGVALNTYAAEHGRYPSVEPEPNFYWATVIAEHMDLPHEERPEIFQDPTVELEAPANEQQVSHYSAHQWIFGNPQDDEDRFPGLKPMQLAYPESVILVVTGVQADANGNVHSALWNLPWLPYDGDYSTRLNDPIPLDGADEPGGMDYRLNNDSVGVVMADGHVEMIPRGEVTYKNAAPIAH